MSGFGGRGSIPSTNFSHGSSVGQSARLLTEWSWVQVPLVTKTYQSLNDNLVPLGLSLVEPGGVCPLQSVVRVHHGTRDAPKHCSNTLQRAVLD